MRFLFIRVEKANYPLTVLCRVLEVSRSGYYAFEKAEPSRREIEDRELTAEIQAIHKKSRRRYGSPTCTETSGVGGVVSAASGSHA